MTIARAPRQAATIFIFITIVLDGVAGGMALPVLPTLVTQLTGSTGAALVTVFGIFGTVFYLTQFFAAPIQGALSDRFGRRPVVLGSNFGMAANYVLFALAPSVPWLYAAQAFSGIASGSQSTATAYMIDVTPPENRTRMFVYMNVAMSVGFIAGPALSGIAATIDIRAPFWIASALCLINGLYGTFVLPESLKNEHRATGLTWKGVNPIVILSRLSRSYPVLTRWAIVAVVSGFAMTGINAIYTVYLTERYSWNPQNLAFYLSFFGVWSLVVQLLIMPRVSKWMGDRRSILVGGLIAAIGITGMGLAPLGIIYAGIAFFWSFFMTLNGAATRAMISRVVGPSEQGRLQGALGSLTAMVGILAPGLFAFLLAEGLEFGGKPFSGLPFWVCGILTAIATGIAIWITRPRASAPAPDASAVPTASANQPQEPG